MIAVTGDTLDSGSVERLMADPVVLSMDKNDFLVILGGCSITLPRVNLHNALSSYRNLPCSVLFLDSGSDDYDLLAEYPTFPWNGGRVKCLSRGIFCLLRGQVFSIGGTRFLSFGGASTPCRKDVGKYYDWWPEQDIVSGDIEEAVSNLSRIGGEVDYVFSSVPPVQGSPYGGAMLDSIQPLIKWRIWFFSDKYLPGPQGRGSFVPVGKTVKSLT